MSNRWEINKLGLVNFWYYDIEEFKLKDGKLLLRGSNGSGKSVTMQSFIPLLLDGNKSPERLDPFGTKARTISNYLLDENTDEKTAYLYMEFKRKDAENYITIGMGMKAVKGKSPQSWYFALTDGRRINKDLFLYREAGEKIPLTKKQLENDLGGGNFYTESQGKYMEKVNELLFGYDDIDSYEELLNLLISIRSPKLSKDFKPTEIYKILTDSLKVLSEDDLRPMSESMENMDSYKNTLEDNIRALEAANKIRTAYDRYNRYILKEKAEALIEKNTELVSLEKDIKLIKKEIQEEETLVVRECEELSNLENSLRKAEESYERLQNREEVQLQKELIEINNRVSDTKRDKTKKEEVLEIKKSKERETEYIIKDEKDKLDLEKDKVKNALKELEDLAEEGYFIEGTNISQEIIRDIENSDISLIEPAMKLYISNLKKSKDALELYERKKEEKDSLVQKQDSKNEELQLKVKDLRMSEELLYKEKEDYKVRYVAFNSSNEIFRLEEEKVKEIIKAIDESEDEKGINKIRELNLNNKGELANNLNGKKLIKDNEVKRLNDEVANLKNEIDELKKAKEIVPDRTLETIRNRQRLVEEGIPFIPLYKAIDFNKNVSDELKNKIESALFNMGILDALCIEEKFRGRALDFKEDMSDKYLFPEPNFMRHNISNYLKVNKEALEGVPFDVIDNVLQGIFLEDNTLTYLDEKGNFGIGILVGKGEDSYKSKYIGEASRKKLREELIANKKSEIDDIIKSIEVIKSEINIIDKEMDLLNSEYKSIPTLEGISEGFYLINKNEKEIEGIEIELKNIVETLYDVQQQFNELKVKVYELVQKLEVKTLKDVSEAIEVMEDFRDALSGSKEMINSIKSKIAMLKIREKALEEIREDLDNIYYELSKINLSIERDSIRVKSIEEVLSKSSINEIKEEIEKCISIKNNYPEIINKKRKDKDRKEINIENQTKKVLELESKKEVCIPKVEQLKNILVEEESLEFLGPKKGIEIIVRAKEILKEIDVKEKQREDFTSKLFESFNNYHGDLRDYTPKIVDILNDEEQSDYSGLRRRKEIKCRVSGKEVGFLNLIDEITANIEEQKLLISNSEREIFQEVLVNTISQKINAKIHQSKQWVKKVNDLMESMDTSSSLKLSLTWQPKKADTEGLLDISEVIDIFERKTLCTEEEFKSLGDHFNKKVQEALRKYEGSGEIRNYHSIIKEVLDYRQWYEFKLFFVKKGERKKELTNNAFFQFSGGEKAMSMYIPLFSAVYARYEKANKDCPRVITMDEAFAGVDENNIRDMFRLLKVLDLDYMLNSQALWGDYDTVDALAIVELLREENDDVVTILKYEWNGKEKILVE